MNVQQSVTAILQTMFVMGCDFKLNHEQHLSQKVMLCVTLNQSFLALI